MTHVIDASGNIKQSGGGNGADEKVKVSANDTTADYLLAKLAAGTGIAITEINDGGNEDAQIAVSSHDHTAPGEGGQLDPIVNQLTNGGHEIWQRGAGAFTANNAYAADRWRLIEAGTDTLSVARDGANKKTNSQYASAITFVLGDGAGATQYRQKLVISDNYHGLLGETISFRASVKLAAGVASAVRAFITTDGTGGTTTYSAYHGNNTNWEDLDVDGLAVPSDATYILVGLAFAASCTAYMDNCMLVIASLAFPYQALQPAEEWERCQRYYEVQGGEAAPSWVSGGYNAAGEAYYVYTSFVTRKAITPTMTKNGVWFLNNLAQPTPTSPSPTGFTLQSIVTALGNSWFYCNGIDDTVTAEANP